MLAIVTGATRGIGYGIAYKLLSDGWTVIGSARGDDKSDLTTLFASSYEFINCDISSATDRRALVDSVVAKYGTINLLVNNAGVAPKSRADLLSVTEEDYDYVMDINLKGTFFLTQDVANVMKSRMSGRIVNISSISSYTASVNRAEYCISKAGISMCTKLFASKLAEYNIGVFEIMPGIIETEMTSSVKQKYADLIDNGITPIRRFGTPKDIADCVSAIANGSLDFCTGSVINADGGFSIRRL